MNIWRQTHKLLPFQQQNPMLFSISSDIWMCKSKGGSALPFLTSGTCLSSSSLNCYKTDLPCRFLFSPRSSVEVVQMNENPETKWDDCCGAESTVRDDNAFSCCGQHWSCALILPALHSLCAWHAKSHERKTNSLIIGRMFYFIISFLYQKKMS